MVYREISTDQFSPLMGAFFGASLLMVMLFLDRVQGKAYRIQDFLSNRKWHLIQSENVIIRVNFMLKITCWIFFSLPAITLAIWGSGVIARLDDDNQNVAPGIAILLCGSSLMFLLYGALKIKWNRYRMSRTSGFCLFMAVLLFTAYQMVVIFMDDDETFFGIAAVFLTANAVVMIILTFLHNQKKGLSILEVIKQLPEGPDLDVQRQTRYDDEITDAYEQDDYLPTQNEIFEMFTVSRVNTKKGFRGVFEGGFSKLFFYMSTNQKILITIGLYSLALIILGVYALLDWTVRSDSGIGIVTMVAVIATDLLLYLYVYSKIAISPAEVSLHLVVFRICLFVLGGDYWIYGYCLLYLYIGIFLSYHIAKRRFPFLDKVIEDFVENEDDEFTRSTFDIATTPEFLLLLATVMFALIMGVMEAVQPDNIPLERYDVDNEDFDFWVFGLFSVLLVAFVFFTLLVLRIFVRRRTGVQSKKYYFVHFKEFDLLWFFLVIDYLIV